MSVFIGRETEVTRDEFPNMRPSTEAPDPLEELSRLTSDLQYDHESDFAGSMKSGSPEKKTTGPGRRGRPSKFSSKAPNGNEKPGEDSSAAGEQPRQRQRAPKQTAGPSADTGARRSARVQALTDKAQQPAPVPKGGAGSAKKKPGRKSTRNNAASTEEYEVSKIIDSQIDADTHQHFYLVRWKGCSSKEDTWEPKVNLAHCQTALRDFEKRGKSKGKK